MTRLHIPPVWKNYSQLFRIFLSLAVAGSAFTGFISTSQQISNTSLYLFFGVFLLALGASSLNQYQEIETDALMARTKQRPLPTKHISKMSALLIAILSCLIGFLILFFCTTPVSGYLGLGNIILYNGIYTPLKRKTKYALYIGGITGGLLPLIGSTAAGASLMNHTITLSLFMYLWQLLHFFLLWIRYGTEYVHAGFPALTLTSSTKHLSLALYLLTVLYCGVCILFSLVGLIQGSLIQGVVVLYAILFLSTLSIVLLRSKLFIYFRELQYCIYASGLFIHLLVILDVLCGVYLF